MYMFHSIFFVKKFKFILFFIIAILCFLPSNPYCFALSNNINIYTIYDHDGNIISQSNYVEIGDKIINSSLEEFEVFYIDNNTYTAYASYNGWYSSPNVNKNDRGLMFSNPNIKKSVGLYMTHNDESYVPSDNTSSIYGKGGIHDVSKKLKNEFEKLNYTVYLDESLHLPHDSKAYTRSSTTANNLLNKNIDALFDIHRDGVARSVYVKNIDNIERCQVRIVVGQANPNKDANLQFAMYLVTVAKEYCPWLFLDIYYAKGHYNQALTNKGLLFEMGTYLAEKELVLQSVPYLAKVIDKTLFSTVVEDDKNITITDTPNKNQQENIVNNVLSVSSKNTESKTENNIVVFSFVFIFSMSIIIFFVYKKKQFKKFKIDNKKNK